MATFKNDDRDEVVEGALSAAFGPRFVAIRKQLELELRKKLKKEHPEFIKLLENEDTRKYLATMGIRAVLFVAGDESLIAALPAFGKRSTMPNHGGYWRVSGDSGAPIQISDIAVPCCLGEFKVANVDIIASYRKAWSDYVAAYDKLRALVQSYTVREKFTADFPEFAKYLPAPTVKAKLPVVIANDVRAELSALGIPQR